MKSEKNVKLYSYAVLDYDEQFEDGYFFESMLDEGAVEGLVQAAAEHLDSECIWGAASGEGEILMEVFKADGVSLGVFEVHKRLTASFNIYPKNKSVDSTSQAGSSHG
ncbi:Uncharacterized protein MCB1EB_0450 [Mycoavidus cysteinexigens]|uniref:Uncharacterized protein n=1 Tax=Mycoavidus cysteinexigens TaxID=1553431 RepID=A0A2Z6ET93_9BURK|nr:hypothetical protein [Mycoavidus cysteinexigens]BBE08611.1 Uncharacterized protein MCB1EB_0450 [Mycoavidus cysteinexigens]GAM52686.1 hypothetical protein EBME_1149 [bacterium endosymbiont of Mortierella elongata FMR23-6]GLR01525.1 hypothetical protein GCM10007934_13370 [Mycoavidus cysteinexigens]